MLELILWKMESLSFHCSLWNTNFIPSFINTDSVSSLCANKSVVYVFVCIGNACLYILKMMEVSFDPYRGNIRQFRNMQVCNGLPVCQSPHVKLKSTDWVFFSN